MAGRMAMRCATADAMTTTTSIRRTGAKDAAGRGHLEAATGRDVGMGGAYDVGPQRIAWAQHMLTDWIGDHGFLHRLSVSVRRPNLVGDTIWWRGRVTDKREAGGAMLVDLDVEARNQMDAVSAFGDRRSFALPSRQKGPVPPAAIVKEMRRLPIGSVPASFEGEGRAGAYAEEWLAMAGAEIAPGGPPIRLWDFQVGMDGSGADASAVSGPAAAIGHADGPGVPLPADMPEKWCGLVGAILALAEAWRGIDGRPARIRCLGGGHHARLRAPELRHAGGAAAPLEAQRAHLRRAWPYLSDGLLRLPGRPCRAARALPARLAADRGGAGRP